MIVYVFRGERYRSITDLRRRNPDIVFPRGAEALAIAGITTEEIPDPEPTTEQKLRSLEAAIDAHIMEVMNARSYDSITSCITYLGSSNARWNSDAQDALAWRTAVWEKAYDLLNKWQRGEISELTPEEVIAQLPEIEWTAGA